MAGRRHHHDSRWRVIVHLESDPGAIGAVRESLSSVGEESQLFEDGVVFAVEGRRALSRGRRIANASLRRAGVEGQVETERWNPRLNYWQTTEELEPHRESGSGGPHPDNCELEVVLRPFLPGRAKRLAQEAADQGWTAVARGSELRIAATDERQGEQVVDWSKGRSRFVKPTE